MTAVASVQGLTKSYRAVTALDSVSFSIEEHSITGLLGRNGAGKTTIMQVLTGQSFPTSGTVSVFGEDPAENEAVLSRTCFIKESQRYNDDFKIRHVLAAAGIVYPNWDAPFAEQLTEDFGLPLSRAMKKLSRGMLSAVGVIIGLASRAPLTFFDEPYLGLDAVARQLFYDRLLADYAENPRTVVLSTHLVDEVADLLSHVLLIDRGRILVDSEAELLRGQAIRATGPRDSVSRVVAGRQQLACERLGDLTRATVRGPLDEVERREAVAAGVSLEPISLQQLMLLTTTRSDTDTTTRQEALR